jgi:hypothetical protein
MWDQGMHDLPSGSRSNIILSTAMGTFCGVNTGPVGTDG